MGFGMVRGPLEIVSDVVFFFWGRKSIALTAFSKSACLAGAKISNICRHSGPQAPVCAQSAQCPGFTDGPAEAG